ncbi:glycoside hydrolase family 32 protein [Aspergillus alliaceus]|uniref:glycoside hydrolase family 32 protein n=1 Tax=Petromyces alliaceus TaxID=209559 RepID=UPI0012A55263|nr:glycosyl hydrolase [Aspergillus alliaceus]KAB8230171.1 glycosyl hydrolase [Aspergillus alliaceus]
MRLPSVAEVLVARQAAGSAGIDYNAPPPVLSTLPSGSLFETWRPKIHVLPPNGQIGDPCAHYNDPATGSFHVGFLHNGTGISAVQTDDLVHYVDVNENGNYTIVAGGPNDPLAIFDGTVIPSGIDGKPTLLYTSVSSLPIHWTLPYVRGSESQSLAVTYDGGHNFTKLDRPPVIPVPPEGLDVTAFRDPYVFQNRDLDNTVGSSPGTWYATISGGVHDVGPGIFLYRSRGSDFEDWEYLGEWWSEPANSTWGNGDWAKVWGYNFETSNVFSLDGEGYNVNGETFITVGVEGSYAPITETVSSQHGMLWASGSISTPDGGNVTFKPTMAGVIDWGISAYAASGKVLPATSQASEKSGAPDRFIIYVWLNQVFGASTGFPDEQQGWQNTLLLPRELTKKTINVANNELVWDTGSWRVEKDGESCAKLETMGIDIARETYKAMKSTNSFKEPKRTLSSAGSVPFERSPTTKFFVLDAQISFPKPARESGVQAGFKILSSDHESTTVYYQFSNESIVIDRTNTSAAGLNNPGFDASAESGRLRLFDIRKHCNGGSSDHDDEYVGHGKGKEHDGHKAGSYGHHAKHSKSTTDDEEIETLDLTIVVDNSVLEVYANSRFALATWARTWYANSTGISFFHNGVGEVSFSDISVSDGLYNAYPERTR